MYCLLVVNASIIFIVLLLWAGGADRTVKLWEVDTKLCVQEYVGHGDVVRDIKVTSSETFLSAANDWWAVIK